MYTRTHADGELAEDERHALVKSQVTCVSGGEAVSFVWGLAANVLAVCQ